MRLLLTMLWLAWLPLAGVAAETVSPASPEAEFFESQIRPVLENRCNRCHGEKKQKGGLRLDSRPAILQGGETGPAVVPGDAEKSLLVSAVKQTGDISMPPDTRLPEKEIGLLSEWVQHGAAWPDSPAGSAKTPAGATAPALTDEQRHWWSFQPLRPSPPPAVSAPNPIDRFLQHELEARGLTPLGPASKRSLLRRATFDLIGLPPTPEEIAAFLADATPGAFDRVVERLLASPRYGEHWGRHWLDVARYTDYLNGNNPSPQEYAEAFRYRDWVVSAFNRNLPYDRFIEAQIAGDLIPGTPLAATGALALGVYDNADSDKNKIVSDIVADQIDFTSKAFLGLTIGCARCHDHKFDPISQRDYYALAGIFYSSSVLADLGKPGLASDFLRPALEGPERKASYEQLQAQLKTAEAQLKKAEESKDAKVPDFTAKRDGLKQQLAAQPVPTYVVAIAEGGVPRSLFPGTQDVPLHLRGSYAHLGALVPRGFPRVLAGENQPPITQGSGRLELAHWLASPQNPLTARVMVNRLWQGHFGEGLVRSTNNFGKLGEAPANPALLDWLASEFIQSGWSLKAMHRLIMSSAAYQRAAAGPEAHFETDPENRFLARFPTRRLEAEEIRDAMLSAASVLDPAMGGPAGPSPLSARRSLYVSTTRKNRANFSTLFDAADPELCVEKRDVSTVAPQALFFLNSPFVLAQATALARRLLAETPDETARIARAYERLFGREPDETERRIGHEFLARHPATLATAWTAYAHLLLCSNEFLILD
jgi:cytochrome c553